MRKNRREHSIQILFPIALFLIFCCAALSVLLVSVRFYQNTAQRRFSNADARSAAAYVRELMHQNDAGFSLSEFDGIPCICIEREDGYLQYVYLLDGTLRELYTKKGADVTPADGQVVMELAALSMEETQPGVYTVVCEDTSGNCRTVIVTKKSKRGDG